jgi:hypothetical protein
MSDDEVEMTSAPVPEPKPVTPDPAPAPEPQAAPVATDAPPAEAKPEGDKTPQRPDPFQARINKLTKEKYDLAREKAALEIKLAQLQPAPAPAPAATDAPPVTAPAAATREPDPETLIEQKVEQRFRQKVYQDRVSAVLNAGNGEYKDFTDRCNVVANLGGADRPDFMEIVTDPAIVPDGHKIIAALADDPNEAARILSMPTVAMSAELARYAEKIGKPQTKPAAISRVPDPIRPLNGAAVANTDPSDDDAEPDWYAKRQAQRAQRKQVGRSL